MAPTRRALIFGATGYTGRALVKALRARSWGVWAHLRPAGAGTLPLDAAQQAVARERWLREQGAEPITRPWEPTALSEVLELARPTVVFSVLGTTRQRAKGEALRGDIYDQVDRRLTEMAIEATCQRAPAAVFVYLSAVGAGFGRGAYLQARARVEASLRASGLTHLIARPGFITGPDREETRIGERIAAGVSDAVLGVVGRLGGQAVERKYRSLSGGQLATALIELVESGAGLGRVVESEQLRAAARASGANT